MTRPITSLACAALLLVLPASTAFANHVPPEPVPESGRPLAVPAHAEGQVRAIANAPAAQAPAAPFGETPPFARDGRRYMITSSMWYGLQVVDVTDPTDPSVVSTYAAATTCASYPEAVASGDSPGDVLAAQGGWENDLAFTPDGRIAILGQDAGGRCHDPRSGGIELVDVSDVRNPRTLHLVRNVGESHSVTIDPVNPHLAYISTSDSSDFIEIVDFRSCLGGVEEIEECTPTVGRAVFDKAFYPALTDPRDPKRDVASDGCHDLRFRGPRAYCAAIDVTLIFDTSRALGADGALTGTDLTAGEDGCELVDAQQSRAPGVKVTDCLGWTEAAFAERNARPVDLPLVSWVDHRADGPPESDVEIAHQAEAIADGRIMIVTDERGGGLNTAGPDGANACPGGGIHFYDVTDERNPVMMKTADGKPAVFISQSMNPSAASCTVHYGSEFADENLLVFAWYTGGVHLIRYDVDFTTHPATVTFDEVAAFVPAGGEVIQAQGFARNPDDRGEVLVYTADWFRGIDVLGATVKRVTRAAAFETGAGGPGKKGTGGTVVKGARTALPATGASDPVTAGLALLVCALAAGNRLRRARL